jgi:hypothetical protein
MNINLEIYEIPLDKTISLLQSSLVDGWKQLIKSNSMPVYREAFEFFTQAGLYEGLFRPHIPNPVYDNAAKEMGKLFLAKSLELGISYAELFPGDFSISTESTNLDKEYRIFYLTAYFNRKKIGTFKLSFEHRHDYFDFPNPPTLEII